MFDKSTLAAEMSAESGVEVEWVETSVVVGFTHDAWDRVGRREMNRAESAGLVVKEANSFVESNVEMNADVTRVVNHPQ